MDFTSCETPAQPFCRGPADEEVDLAAIMNNIASGTYREWPNDAGFDGLIEERGPVEIPVSGSIPTWAAGSLYRTGPGVYKIDNTAVGTFYTSHWFDGLAHSHRFDIVPNGDGVKVFYSSRRQSEQMVEHIRRHGTRKFLSFGQRKDPCLGLFSKIMSTWKAASVKPKDKVIENISVVVLPDFPGLRPTKLETSLSISEPPSDFQSSAAGHRLNLPKSVWISTDNSGLKQIDPRTLEPIGFAAQQTLHPDLSGPTSCAHAQKDPLTGDVFNFNLQFGRKSTYRIFRVSASTGKTDILATISEPGLRPAYIHSFFLSPSFVILCVPSSHLGMGGARILWEGNILDAIEPFRPDKKCKWIVVDRLCGKGVVAQFETGAGFFFHTINAFEERVKLCEDPSKTDTESEMIDLFCDVVEYPNLDVMSSLYYDVLLQKNGAGDRFWGNMKHVRSSISGLARYHLRIPTTNKDGWHTGSGSAITKLFSIPAPHSGELPTINPQMATKRQRYVYSLAFLGRSTLADSIVKTDMTSRQALFWNTPPGHTPGEAIFVPRPYGSEEDDGVLLSVVLDGGNRTSYLVCLDAKTMAELGRAVIGFAVGLGFHGVHITGSR